MPALSSTPASIREYYQNPDVRAAILCYCGAEGVAPPSAAFVAGLRGGATPMPTWERDAVRVAVTAIEALWEGEYDIARSLWDRRNLMWLFELDYQNADAPGEPFIHPADTFLKLEPTYRATRRVLSALGIRPQVIMTGRGYQFTGAIPLGHRLVSRLAALAPEVPGWFDGLAVRRPEGVRASMTPLQARASIGLGLLIEFLAHLVRAEAQPVSPIPVMFNGTLVGSGGLFRESVSIDFSHVGDPLDVRHFRAAFSTYQFHRFRPDIVGAPISRGVPVLVARPRSGRALMPMLTGDRGLAAGVRDSRRRSAVIPDVTAGLERLRRHYQESALAAFHRSFYRGRAVTSGEPPRLAGAPPCVMAALDYPNDLLLKPEFVQHVVRGLMARGWRPIDIAKLVQERYEADYGWGDRWDHMHARSRAEFDVRVFAGLIVTGADALVDFNCVSAQEKNLCSRAACRFDLRREWPALRALQPSQADLSSVLSPNFSMR